jgi:hypothetical protein
LIHLLCLFNEIVKVVSLFVILRSKPLVEFGIQLGTGTFHKEVCEQKRSRSLMWRSLLGYFQPFPEIVTRKSRIHHPLWIVPLTRPFDNLPGERRIFGGNLSGFLQKQSQPLANQRIH